MTDNKKALIIAIIITGLCAIVYAQTYGFDFINIDDRPYIWENLAVQSGLNTQSIRWAFTSFYAGNWHPLTWMSHMLDAELYGPWAGGHHITNAILHTLNSLLVFFVFRSMTGAIWRSALVAVLFAVHPAHVESVAWVAERKDVLSTAFWLFAMLAYARYAKSTDDTIPIGRRLVRLLPVVILFAIGLMAKPMLVTLPFALLLCDYWPLGRLSSWNDLRLRVLEKIPLFILTVSSAVVTYAAQSRGGAVASLIVVPLETRLANTVISYGRYLLKLVYPVNLGIWYPMPPIDARLLILSLVVIGTITWLASLYRKTDSYFLVGWLWFLGTLVPVIGIVQVGLQSHADRYTYVPYIGLFVIVAWGGGKFSETNKLSPKVLTAGALLAVSALTVLAYRQTSLWRSSESLYTHTLSFTERNEFITSNLCMYYLQKSDAATADERCSSLLATMPPSADSFQVLGYVKMQTGKYEESLRFYQEAARFAPSSGAIHMQMAQVRARLGNAAAAEQLMQQALAMREPPANPTIVSQTAVEIGDAFVKAGRKDKGIEYYQKALSSNPNNSDVRSKLDTLRAR